MSTTNQRAFNFNAGPSALPLEVLQIAEKQLVNFNNTGMSVMELSHRSKDFEQVHNEAIARLRQLYAVPDNYEVIFYKVAQACSFQ